MKDETLKTLKQLEQLMKRLTSRMAKIGGPRCR